MQTHLIEAVLSDELRQRRRTQHRREHAAHARAVPSDVAGSVQRGAAELRVDDGAEAWLD